MKKYTECLLSDFLSQFSTNPNNDIHIPFTYLEVTKEKQDILQWIKQDLDNYSKTSKIPFLVQIEYNKERILLKGEKQNMIHSYVTFDYMEREKYIQFCYKINKLIPDNGLVALYVSNIAGYLNALLYLEYPHEIKEEINNLITNYYLEQKFDKSMADFTQEQAYRKWNSTSFFSDCDLETFTFQFLCAFYHPSNTMLKQNKYDFDKEFRKKKLFISYSWKDKEIVRNFVDILNDNNIDTWIDITAIDYGENILSSINNGIKECDVYLCFISNNYKISQYGKHELISIWNIIIQSGKPWKIVNLDKTNPDEISPLLSHYKYFDYAEESLNSLIISIKKSLNM